MSRVAIVQSNYIPWRGYFDLIAACDFFVVYDRVQYTRRDWRNRNQIKTPSGLKWLTVPVLTKGKYTQSISETRIDGSDWQAEHFRALQSKYARAKHFADVSGWLGPFYLEREWEGLSELNVALIRRICRELGIQTEIRDSSEFDLAKEKTHRLAGICSQLEANCYVSGPAAQSYLDVSVFTKLGMEVEWFDYSGYPEYPQLWGEFQPNVSIVDLLFNCGPDAPGLIGHERPS